VATSGSVPLRRSRMSAVSPGPLPRELPPFETSPSDGVFLARRVGNDPRVSEFESESVLIFLLTFSGSELY
jgi:hypothetical protein